MNSDSVFSISTLKIGDNEGFAKILEKAKAGDSEALGQLYDLCFEKIYRFIFYRVGHKEVAEDLAEEVFIKAFSGLASLQEAKSFEGWLYQIARNQVIDYYRAKKQLIALDEVENTLEYESNIIDILHLQDQQKIFLKLLRELAPEQQIVIRLKFLEDLRNEEIAELLHKSEGAIRVIQHRAISKLKELLSRLKAKNNE